MNRAFIISIWRTIYGSLGRYLAILAIIALGVGFFSGLKLTKPAMIRTADNYVQEYRLFDFRVLSAIGFTAEEADRISEIDGILAAEGAVFEDFIFTDEHGGSGVLRAHSITERVNRLVPIAGRLPEKADEIALDAARFPETYIGSKIAVAADNPDMTQASFAHAEYTVTGIVQSVMYMNTERGTTTLGNGKLSGFAYIPPSGFVFDRYKELYVAYDHNHEIYSEAYKTETESLRQRLEPQIRQLIDQRFKLDVPSVHLLSRETNIGYASFENDADVVQGISNVFPVFFFLIAALVCSTTMTRMVDDDRTQIGTLRAMGYGSAAIMSKYLIYSGSAAAIGCIAGYTIGIRLFPYTIWQAYNILYGFAPIEAVMDPVLFWLSMAVSLLCSAGTTYAACRNELRHMPAELIRPKAPPAGKRILLERIGPLWRRMKFLHKVTARNIFRFKKRMFMMILGIAGCTALVVTGFGLRDSIIHIVDYQFDEIMHHEVSVTYAEGITGDDITRLLDKFGDRIERHAVLLETSSDAVRGDERKALYLIATDDSGIGEFVDLHRDGVRIAYPGAGQAAVSEKLAEFAGVEVGDEIMLRYGDDRMVTLRVSGIFENYVYHYAYVSAETFEEAFGEPYVPNTMYLILSDDADEYEVAAELAAEGAAGVSVVRDIRTSVENTMSQMNYVVLLVIACAGALAFIVLFNLTNINISERVREIATLKVLGFYPGETRSYVFRENVVLSLMGIVLGLPLGVLLHRFVMDQIQIDIVSFEVTIQPISYLYAVVTVLTFTVLVNLLMGSKIERIRMAESLKSIE